MKKQLLTGVLAISAAAGVASAQLSQLQKALGGAGAKATNTNTQGGAAPAAVTQMIAKKYPGAQTSVVNSREENGVHVYDIRVAPTQGQPFTVVATDAGEMLEAVWDFGGNTQGITPAVNEFTQNIWKTPPTDVRLEIGTFYWVTIGGSGKTSGRASDAGSTLYELRFDGAGRLLDMRAPSQLHRDNWEAEQNAPQDVAQKLSQIAQTRYAGAKIVAVKQIASLPGFFEVRFTRNGDGWMRADQNGDISDEAYTINPKQLPQAVQQTLNDTFKGDRVTWAAHDETKFYQVRETVGSEQLALRVQPDGEVLSVHQDRHAEGAMTAAGHSKGQKNTPTNTR